MSPTWTIVEHKGREGLMRLADDWSRLVAAMPGAAFQDSHAAHVGYFDNYPNELGQFSCLALSDGTRIRAIIPVELQRDTPLRFKMLRWALPSGLGDLPRDLICPPDDEAERALLLCVTRHLRRARPGASLLVLNRVLENSASMRCLRGLPASRYCLDLDGSADFIDCNRPYGEIAAALSKNFRGNLRKARNKLAAIADRRFDHATDPQSAGTAYQSFVEVEGSGWKGAGGTRSSVAMLPRLLAFLSQLIDSLHEGGRCEINSLHTDGRCIASQYCIRFGTEYAILKIGFDERYAHVAPGQLLMEEVLQRCCADPSIERVNLESDAAWHRDWRPKPVKLYNAYIGIGGLPARALIGVIRARFRFGPTVKRWLRRIRETRR